MTEKEKQKVLGIIENEGFHYTFRHYTDFNEIKDKEFHKLIDEFIDSSLRLENYLEDTNGKNIS